MWRVWSYSSTHHHICAIIILVVITKQVSVLTEELEADTPSHCKHGKVLRFSLDWNTAMAGFFRSLSPPTGDGCALWDKCMVSMGRHWVTERQEMVPKTWFIGWAVSKRNACSADGLAQTSCRHVLLSGQRVVRIRVQKMPVDNRSLADFKWNTAMAGQNRIVVCVVTE